MRSGYVGFCVLAASSTNRGENEEIVLVFECVGYCASISTISDMVFDYDSSTSLIICAGK